MLVVELNTMARVGIGGHDECRKLICAICLTEGGQKCTRTVSENEVILIKQYVSDNYDVNDPKFATGICNSCQRKLIQMPDKDSKVKLRVSSQFCVTLPPQTRARTQATCECTICTRARMNGGRWLKFRKDCKTMDSIVLKRGEKIKLCPICFSKIYPGSKHSQSACQSKETLVENLSKIDPKYLKAALKEQNVDVIETKYIPQPEPNHVYTKDDAKHLKKITGISGNQARTVLQFIRVKEGPGHVEPHIRENIAKDKKVFEPYFDIQRAKFNESMEVPEMDKEVPIFFCHDPDGFIDKECELLGINPKDFKKKLGIDSGKGSEKLTLTLRLREQPEPEEIPRKKSRVTHKDTVQVGVIVKPWPQILSPKPFSPKPKTKGPWADTKML